MAFNKHISKDNKRSPSNLKTPPNLSITELGGPIITNAFPRREKPSTTNKSRRRSNPPLTNDAATAASSVSSLPNLGTAMKSKRVEKGGHIGLFRGLCKTKKANPPSSGSGYISDTSDYATTASGLFIAEDSCIKFTRPESPNVHKECYTPPPTSAGGISREDKSKIYQQIRSESRSDTESKASYYHLLNSVSCFTTSRDRKVGRRMGGGEGAAPRSRSDDNSKSTNGRLTSKSTSGRVTSLPRIGSPFMVSQQVDVTSFDKPRSKGTSRINFNNSRENGGQCFEGTSQDQTGGGDGISSDNIKFGQIEEKNNTTPELFVERTCDSPNTVIRKRHMRLLNKLVKNTNGQLSHLDMDMYDDIAPSINIPYGRRSQCTASSASDNSVGAEHEYCDVEQGKLSSCSTTTGIISVVRRQNNPDTDTTTGTASCGDNGCFADESEMSDGYACRGANADGGNVAMRAGTSRRGRSRVSFNDSKTIIQDIETDVERTFKNRDDVGSRCEEIEFSGTTKGVLDKLLCNSREEGVQYTHNRKTRKARSDCSKMRNGTTSSYNCSISSSSDTQGEINYNFSPYPRLSNENSCRMSYISEDQSSECILTCDDETEVASFTPAQVAASERNCKSFDLHDIFHTNRSNTKGESGLGNNSGRGVTSLGSDDDKLDVVRSRKAFGTPTKSERVMLPTLISQTDNDEVRHRESNSQPIDNLQHVDEYCSNEKGNSENIIKPISPTGNNNMTTEDGSISPNSLIQLRHQRLVGRIAAVNHNSIPTSIDMATYDVIPRRSRVQDNISNNNNEDEDIEGNGHTIKDDDYNDEDSGVVDTHDSLDFKTGY